MSILVVDAGFQTAYSSENFGYEVMRQGPVSCTRMALNKDIKKIICIRPHRVHTAVKILKHVELTEVFQQSLGDATLKRCINIVHRFYDSSVGFSVSFTFVFLIYKRKFQEL